MEAEKIAKLRSALTSVMENYDPASMVVTGTVVKAYTDTANGTGLIRPDGTLAAAGDLAFESTQFKVGDKVQFTVHQYRVWANSGSIKRVQNTN